MAQWVEVRAAKAGDIGKRKLTSSGFPMIVTSAHSCTLKQKTH